MDHHLRTLRGFDQFDGHVIAGAEGVDDLGQKAMGCFELKDEIPVDYCLDN